MEGTIKSSGESILGKSQAVTSFWESKAGKPIVNYRRSHLEYSISLVCSNSGTSEGREAEAPGHEHGPE